MELSILLDILRVSCVSPATLNPVLEGTSMRIVRDVLSLGLVTSALLGILILTTDQWLRTAAPSHAYGLIGFVIVDILLTIAVLENLRLGTSAAAIASLVQVTLMMGDLFLGQPEGIPSSSFRSYLINDPSYTGLLLIKMVIIAVAISRTTIPFLQRHAHWIRSLHTHGG